jgi:SAM-dependent methyltransferase
MSENGNLAFHPGDDVTDTKVFFDSYARDFDSLYGVPKNNFNRLLNSLFRKSMKMRFEKTMACAHPIRNMTVLDIGCGPGLYSVAFALAGAKRVVGIDFSPRMITIAKERARAEDVSSLCDFSVMDFFDYSADRMFTYSVAMGFMDYIAEPVRLIRKAVELTDERLFFSFPVDGGLLAAQRRWRYRKRCPLFMYTKRDLEDIFSQFAPMEYAIERIGRDFFVTLKVGHHQNEKHSLDRCRGLVQHP